MSIQEDQAQFRAACGNVCNSYPVDPIEFGYLNGKIALGQVLIQEEFKEFMQALDVCNEYRENPSMYYELLAEVCAEGVDLVYVVMDMFNLLGLPFEAMFREIHRANMSKVVDGQVIRRADGKVLKPKGFKPANKLGVVMECRDYKL